MNYEQMTLKMQDALQSASSLAQQRDHSEIGNEHLLYAMLNQKDGMIPPLVERIGLLCKKILKTYWTNIL